MEKIILMIDKDVEKSRKLKVNLENIDYRVLISQTISDALMLLRANSIDLIIFFNSFENIEKIRENSSFANISIIAILENEQLDDIQEHINSIDEYILAPYNKEELFRCIKYQVKISKLKKVLDQKETELAKAYEKLNDFGLIDDVTGLYNSFYFSHMLANQVATSKRYGYQLSGLMLKMDNDFDETSQFNEIIRIVAQIFNQNIRTNDILVRLNSEEFYLLLPHTGLKDAVFVAEKLRNIVEKYEFGLNEKVTVSIGVTSLGNFESAFTKEEELINKASVALKSAIESGGNKVLWN